MTRSNQPHLRVQSPRDGHILDHVARYRLTTNEVVGKLFFAERKPNAVTKVTARLCRADLLAKHPLIYPRSCFVLGPVAARRLGVSSSRALPPGPQALPIDYATLVYATLGKIRRRRLTAAEVTRLCPWLAGPLADFPYCFDDSGAVGALELVRVDLGGKSDHVARKCDRDIQARRTLGECEAWIRHARFRLVVLTGTSEKAAAVHSALQQHLWPTGLIIHLAVIPHLLPLIASNSHGT